VAEGLLRAGPVQVDLVQVDLVQVDLVQVDLAVPAEGRVARLSPVDLAEHLAGPAERRAVREQGAEVLVVQADPAAVDAQTLLSIPRMVKCPTRRRLARNPTS